MKYFFILSLITLTGCQTYNKTPVWFPNSWNTTISTDKEGYTTYYFGVSGPLKN